MIRSAHQPRVMVIGSLLALLLTLIVPKASAAFRYLQEGMPAPPLEGRDILSDSLVSLESVSAAGVTVVTFWATWSPRSIELLRDLKTLKEQYPEMPFSIIAVNVEGPTLSSGTRTLIKETAETLELPFPVLIDDGLTQFYQYGVIAVPSTAILDSTATLRYAPSGYSLTVRDRIADSIEVLLGIKDTTEAIVLRRGYIPENRASRYYQLALQLAHQRMYERALANLDAAEDADSLFSAPHNLRGQILLRLDSVSAAVLEFAEAVRLDSGSVAAWSGWGEALFIAGDAAAAREKLAVALGLDGSYTPALMDYAQCLLREQKITEALDSLHAARDLSPRNPTVYYLLGRLHQESEDLGEAIGAYRTALEILYPPPE